MLFLQSIVENDRSLTTLFFFSLWEISKTVVKQFTANARETTREGNIEAY